MKFKTLEDFEKNEKYDQDECGYSWNIDSLMADLRQEAIKHINELDKEINQTHPAVHGLLSKINEIEGSEFWHPENVKDIVKLAETIAKKEAYKYFFNIKKEELKC